MAVVVFRGVPFTCRNADEPITNRSQPYRATDAQKEKKHKRHLKTAQPFPFCINSPTDII